MLGDSLKLAVMGGLRAFGVRDTNDVEFWTSDSSLQSMKRSLRLPIAISVRQAAGGRAIVFPFALRFAGLHGGTPPRSFENVPRVLLKIYQQMGLAGPGPVSETRFNRSAAPAKPSIFNPGAPRMTGVRLVRARRR